MSINFVTLVRGEIIQVRAGGRLRNSIIIPVVAHFRLKAISYLKPSFCIARYTPIQYLKQILLVVCPLFLQIGGGVLFHSL